MNCSKCNKEIKEGQEVCLSCGHILGYESENSKKCIHCSREIPQAYKKCPYCKKNQKRKRYILKFILIIIIMLINIYLLTILYSSESSAPSTYKDDCKNITINELINNFIEYDDELVLVEGEVTDVTKVSYFFNRVRITIKDENNKSYIYYNNKQNIGLPNGTKIKIYGKYKELKGNKPIIHAKFIEKNNTE